MSQDGSPVENDQPVSSIGNDPLTSRSLELLWCRWLEAQGGVHLEVGPLCCDMGSKGSSGGVSCEGGGCNLAWDALNGECREVNTSNGRGFEELPSMGVMTEMSRGRFTQGVVVVPEPKLHVIALFFLRSPSKHPPGRLLCICNDKTKQKINFQNLNNNIHQQVMLCQIASDVPENNGDQWISV